MKDVKQQVIIIAEATTEVEEAVKQLSQHGHIVQTIPTTDVGYDLTYVRVGESMKPHYIPNLKYADFSDSKQIRTCEYEERIKELKVKYAEYLENFSIKKLRVIIDEKWSKKEQSKPNSCWKGKIKKIGGDMNDQTGLEYEITLRAFFLEYMTEAQKVALLFDLLSRIQEDGSIRIPHIDDDKPLVNTFGAKFLEDGADIDNMLVHQIDLKMAKKTSKAQQEMTFDEEGNVENPPVQEEGPQDDEPEELITH